MIKSLQVLMLRMEAVFMDAIRRSIYAQLQDFVQVMAQLYEHLTLSNEVTLSFDKLE